MQVFVHDQPRQLDGATTVAELLAQLDLRPQYVAVEVNEQLVPRGVHAERLLVEGDRVEIVTLVGGG